jgi:very-short-patch-repair endonuclease
MSAAEHPRSPKARRQVTLWVPGARGERQSPETPVPPSIWVPEGVRGTGDREIARIAERQRGNVHRGQLLMARIGPGAIRHRLKSRRLHSIYPDVYLVGRPRMEPLGFETAAVLHFAGWAVLSEASATLLWGNDQVGDDYEVTITLIGRHAKSRPGLKVRRVPSLHPDDMARRHGLPVTSPARTLIDRAGRVDALVLENDLAEFRRRYPSQVTDEKIANALDRVPANRAGVARLRALLGAARDPLLTRSGYERKLVALLRRAGLPLPATNVKVCGHQVDAVWAKQRLVVEFDSYTWHSGREAFEADRRRDQDLLAAGYRVIRVTARQLDRDPYAVVARIAAALAVLAA